MRHKEPLPRILKPLFECNLYNTLFTDEHICFMQWKHGSISSTVYFLNEDIFFIKGGKIQLSKKVNSASGIIHWDVIRLYDLHGRVPVKHENYVSSCPHYKYPSDAFGNGQPISMVLYDATVQWSEHKTTSITAKDASLKWFDSRGHDFNRTDGPSCFDLNIVAITEESLSWSVSGEPPQTDSIAKRIPFMNPFRIPFFDDPQDEMEFLTKRNQ